MVTKAIAKAAPTGPRLITTSPLAGYDLALMVSLVGEAVNINYNTAVQAFKANPSADHWKALVLSMHGVQFWRGADEAKKNATAQRLHSLGIGHWAQALRDLQSEGFEEN
jgi:hypothetical protein